MIAPLLATRGCARHARQLTADDLAVADVVGLSGTHEPDQQLTASDPVVFPRRLLRTLPVAPARAGSANPPFA